MCAALHEAKHRSCGPMAFLRGSAREPGKKQGAAGSHRVHEDAAECFFLGTTERKNRLMERASKEFQKQVFNEVLKEKLTEV